MRFTTKQNDHEYSVDYFDGRAIFRCDFINKDFDSLAKLEAAVKAEELRVRKDFSNKTAYVVDTYRSREGVIEVEITSLPSDTEAWIKTSHGRTKRNRKSLYADKAEVERTVKEIEAYEKQIASLWDGLTRWEPKS